MVNVHDYAHNLARALKESAEHQEYLAAKNKIKGNTTVETMISDFQKKQMEAQSAFLQGQEPSEVQKEGLQRLYAAIQGHIDARNYLMAEQRLGILLNDVYKIIREAVELQMPFDSE